MHRNDARPCEQKRHRRAGQVHGVGIGAAVAPGFAAPTGDHEVTVEAPGEAVDETDGIVVAQARCGRVEQHECARVARAVGRPGDDLAVSSRASGAPVPGC